MEDNRMLEDISVEEYEEAMTDFEVWHREITDKNGIPFEDLEESFDDWERCFLAKLEKVQ